MASQENMVTAVPADSRPTVATEETSTGTSPPALEKITTESHLSPESSQNAIASASGSEKPAGNSVVLPASDDNVALRPRPIETQAIASSTMIDATNMAATSDLSNNPSREVDEEGSSLVITLLLITGARHPFKIDGKYLRKRAVTVDNNDPFNMSVYTLKELIWREWRSEWEPRPSSPSAIRLISFGKLLDDKSPLSELKFTHDSPNVVHMTVKPQEIIDEEDAKATKSYQSRDRDVGERTPRCHCIIL